MSQVNVTINGRQFRMACEDGQEDHLMDLAREFDIRIEGLRAKFGEIGDTRLTVMAAITLPMNCPRWVRRIKRLEEDLAGHARRAWGGCRSQQRRAGCGGRHAHLRRRKRIESVQQKTQSDHRRQRCRARVMA